MDFRFAIPSKDILVLNPKGTVAICTLWTPAGYVRNQLCEHAEYPVEALSPVAVIGGLFGGGLNVLLRNLVHNPQINTVILYGKDRSGSGQLLKSFFTGGFAITDRKQLYKFDDGNEQELDKAVITAGMLRYTTDGLLTPGDFKYPPKIIDSISFGEKDGLDALISFLGSYQSTSDTLTETDRKSIPLPVPKMSSFPSEGVAHVISAETILEGWEKLLYRLSRFAIPVELRDDKKRNELLNMKVVIRSPLEGVESLAEHIEVLQEKLNSYKETLLDSSLGEQSYSYGNRVRAYFGCDLLNRVVKDLSRFGDARRSYITLWDNCTDALAEDAPCLVSLFFRKIEDRIYLTATFRSHNAVEAWPQNCLALARVMEFVCEEINMLPEIEEPRALKPGVLTVFSHSISINPKEFPKVKERVEEYAQRPTPIEMDPYGYFRLSIDPVQMELVAQLYDHEDEFLEEFRGGNPDELARVLCRKEAVSDLSHAIYIGRQLERAYFCLRNGKEYVQDKTVIQC